jgi:hypothetical protein
MSTLNIKYPIPGNLVLNSIYQQKQFQFHENRMNPYMH